MAPGTRLGPDEVQEPIGAGEMGEFARKLLEENTDARLAAVFLAVNGRTAEAAAVVDRLLASGSAGDKTHAAAGFIALLAGEYQPAARYLEEAIRLTGSPVGTLAPIAYSRLYSDFATLLACAHLKLGEAERALRSLAETERYYTGRIARGDTSFQARVGLAAVHALRGDEEAAYQWLQQSIDAGLFAYAELERHPCFESLHGQERFQRMMAGVEARLEEVRRRVSR